MAYDMNRRGFLRSSLVLAGGLIVGDEALEALARLTHQRKSFPSADLFKLPTPILPIYELPPRDYNKSRSWSGVIITTKMSYIEPEWPRYGA